MRPPERQYARTWLRYKSRILYDGTCKTCGLTYVRDSPDDRREHERRHRQVLAIYEPKPAPQIFGQGPFLEVTSKSQLRHRNHLEGLGRMFQREFGSCFPPYSATEQEYRELHDKVVKREDRHFLLVSPDGRPIGGTSARRRSCDPDIDPSGLVWLWGWIWIIPSERRKGHMTATWRMMREIIPDIVPEPPLSVGSASFFADRMDVPEWVRQAAADALTRPRDW